MHITDLNNNDLQRRFKPLTPEHRDMAGRRVIQGELVDVPVGYKPKPHEMVVIYNETLKRWEMQRPIAERVKRVTGEMTITAKDKAPKKVKK